MEKTYLTNADVAKRASLVAEKVGRGKKIFGVPRGGIPACYAVMAADRSITMTDDPNDADVIVDDIIDSGATRKRYGAKPFFALVDKTGKDKDVGWVVFPWEGDHDCGIHDNLRRLLQFVGEDPQRGGLIETPARAAKAWRHWTSGYNKDPKQVLKVFEDGGEGYDEMVAVKDIPIYSHCEHHLAPIFGTATIAYIPNGKIVGLSKLSRLADIYARRLQVQERLTQQIADTLDECLSPVGVGVLIKARHMCMESRGICQQGHYTITSALKGAIKDKPEARHEFLEMCK